MENLNHNSVTWKRKGMGMLSLKQIMTVEDNHNVT